MNKMIITGYRGQLHQEMYEYTGPLFQRYAELHGYDFQHYELSLGRPPAWYKLPLLKAALQKFDIVVWLDVDVVILDDSKDILDDCPDEFTQAMVQHHTGEGFIPNSGVLVTTPQFAKFIEEIWDNKDLITHRWWEQAAIMRVMGYTGRWSDIRHEIDTPLYKQTHFLSNEWNWHTNDKNENRTIRFKHITAMKDRIAAIRDCVSQIMDKE